MFAAKWSQGFDPEVHLERVAVVNQTTMLAAETQEVASIIKEGMQRRYGEDDLEYHFADTSDTLCYATNENQNATYALIERGADLALVVGGYNSSNTSHIVELCCGAMPTYFIQGDSEIISNQTVHHFALAQQEMVTTEGWLPDKRPVDVVLTCGASCPDAILDRVLFRVLSLFEQTRVVEAVLAAFTTGDVE
jgi:4-hydroxy-3-methylbut-2-enyl diphosphate reductase